jgi:ABC-type amino acid transport substrate-binding protein
MLKKYFKFLLFLFSVFSLQPLALAQNPSLKLTEAEHAFIAEHPVIRVAGTMDWPPFDYNEFGRPKGLSIDHIKLVAAKVGLQIKFITGHTWAELLDLFEKRQIDVMPVLYRNKRREAFTLYTHPYHKGKLGVFTHEKGLKTTTLSDLLGKRVGIHKNNGAIPIVRKEIPGIDLVEISSIETLVKKLATRKLDAIIGNPLTFSYYAKENQITLIQLSHYIDMDADEQSKTSFHIGVRNDYPILHQILNKSAQAVTDAEITAIVDKWSHIRGDVRQHPSNERIPLSSTETAFLKEHGQIRMCIDPDWMPFERVNHVRQHEGIVADFTQMMVKRLGISIQLVHTNNWEESKKKFHARHCDILSAAGYSKERAKVMLFSRPYYETPAVIATRNEELFIDNIDSVLDKPIGIIRGFYLVDRIRELRKEAHIVETDNIHQGLQLLKGGQIFAFLDTIPAISYAAQKAGITGIKIAGQLDFKNQFHIAAHKGEAKLISIFNKAIDSLTDQDRRIITDRWANVKIDRQTDYNLVLKIILTFTLISFMVVSAPSGMATSVSMKSFSGQTSLTFLR